MANLPVPADQNSDYADLIGARMAKGERPMVIARKLYPNDHKKRLACYMRIRRRALSDQRVAQRIQEEAKIEMMVTLVPAIRALGTRAGRTGRTDAVKALAEISGFHNPRVSHEHSGEIKVKLELPRPTYDIPDADVVEED